MTLWLVAIGAVSMLGQVVLLRELSVAFYGSELVYVLALGAWLLGAAAGASSTRGPHVPSERQVRGALAALGLAVPLAVVLARGVRLVFHGVPGADLPFGQQMLALAACVVPPSVLSGLAFQRAARRWVGKRRTVAGAYAIESAGALAGGLAATLLLALGERNLSAAFGCALLASAAAAWPLRRATGDVAILSLLGGLVALAALVSSGPIDRRLTRWNHPHLLASRDTPYARVTVSRAATQVAVFENDALAYESEGTAAEAFVHLAALQRDAPRTVLVLGGAVPGLIEEVLRLQPQHVDDVEIDRAPLDLVAEHQPEPARRALADGRVQLYFGDSRRFLRRQATYDLILVGMPEPESGRTNRYYTREFFAACARRLAPDGVLALRLRGSENLWTPQLTRRTASIESALRTAFTDVVVLPGSTSYLLASRAPLDRDAGVLAARLRARGLALRLVTPAYVRYLYTNDRFSAVADLLARTAAPANSDLRPACYQSTMLLWLARFFPSLARIELPEAAPAILLRSRATWLSAAAIAGLLLLARRRSLGRRMLLAGAAGFAGMLLECVLLLQYQTRRGVLFQDLGVLLTMFMAGLVLGAATIERRMRAREHRTEPSRALGAALLAALAGLGLATAALLGVEVAGGLPGTAVQLAACGFLVAAIFAVAALQRAPDPRAVISPVYAADLVGGGIGSLAAGLWLIPVLGLPGTALVTVAVALAACLAL